MDNDDDARYPARTRRPPNRFGQWRQGGRNRPRTIAPIVPLGPTGRRGQRTARGPRLVHSPPLQISPVRDVNNDPGETDTGETALINEVLLIFHYVLSSYPPIIFELLRKTFRKIFITMRDRFQEHGGWFHPGDSAIQAFVIGVPGHHEACVCGDVLPVAFEFFKWDFESFNYLDDFWYNLTELAELENEREVLNQKVNSQIHKAVQEYMKASLCCCPRCVKKDFRCLIAGVGPLRVMVINDWSFKMLLRGLYLSTTTAVNRNSTSSAFFKFKHFPKQPISFFLIISAVNYLESLPVNDLRTLRAEAMRTQERESRFIWPNHLFTENLPHIVPKIIPDVIIASQGTFATRDPRVFSSIYDDHCTMIHAIVDTRLQNASYNY